MNDFILMSYRNICNLPKFSASGAVHLIGICFMPSETMYSSSSLDIPKSEILTMHSYPVEILFSMLLTALARTSQVTNEE